MKYWKKKSKFRRSLFLLAAINSSTLWNSNDDKLHFVMSIIWLWLLSTSNTAPSNIDALETSRIELMILLKVHVHRRKYFSRNYDDDVVNVVCIVLLCHSPTVKWWRKLQKPLFPFYVNRQTFCGRIWSYINISKCLQSSGKLTIICVCNTFHTRMSHRLLHGTLGTRRKSVFSIHAVPSLDLFYSNVFCSFLCQCIQYTRL